MSETLSPEVPRPEVPRPEVLSPDAIRAAVRDQYGSVARSGSQAQAGDAAASCAPGCCGINPSSSLDLGYSDADLAAVPEGANLGLGCGNPQAIAALKPGETVLDLGAGAGFDCFLAARAVGPTGKVIGVDMTADMVRKARANAQAAGWSQVEFRLGEIEHLPVSDATVDVILSNCVINLSPDKAAVFRDAYRVLKPGGRLAVSDVVVRGEVSDDVRRNMELWVGCIAGALEERDYAERLQRAGFEGVSVELWRVYDVEDARGFLADAGVDVETQRATAAGTFASAFVRATKPAAKSCCGPTGCS